MPFLIRRINRAKWDQIVDTEVSGNLFKVVVTWFRNLLKTNTDVSADAITNCLKTFNNDLSVWHIETEADLEKAILALITGSNQAKLSTLHVVIIDEQKAINKGIKLTSTPGDTIAKDLINTHKDLTNLTYLKLGVIKELVVDCIKKDKSVVFTKTHLKKIITNAINTGQINKLDLPQALITSEKL